MATVPPAAALVWLGWFVVQQDRLSSRARMDTDRGQAADVGMTALASTLAEFDSILGTADGSQTAGSTPAWLRRAPVLVLNDDGVVSRMGLTLPYCPAVSRPPIDLPAIFATADNLEFARNDPGGAIRLMLGITADARPEIRAEALLRLGRNYRQIGDTTRALDAFGRLAELGDTSVQGKPAGLLGRTGRALLFAAASRAQELRQEAEALARELGAGAWRLTRDEWEHSAAQVAGWLNENPAAVTDPAAADIRDLLSAIDLVWQERNGRASAINKLRSTVRVNDRTVLVISHLVPDGQALLFLTGPVLLDAWRAHLPAGFTNIDFTLTDGDGSVIAGAADPQVPATVRNARTAGLSWTVAATTRKVSEATPLSTGARLMLAGIALMTLVVLAGIYAIARAVSREMRVARLQADFVAAVSHEFRTPLTTIYQLSEMLAQSRVSSPERRQQFFDALVSESRRLQRLVESLLDFGRMEAGKISYARDPLDLGTLVDRVAASVGRDTAPTGHRIDVIHTGEPPAVVGDAEALSHALRNLLDNAVKYSPDHKNVEVTVARENGHALVRVRDRGLGIPLAEQRDIFEKFVRGSSSAARNIAGTGVGLAIVRLIVDAHHGSISVESTPGEGSTFTISLPADQGHESA